MAICSAKRDCGLAAGLAKQSYRFYCLTILRNYYLACEWAQVQSGSQTVATTFVIAPRFDRPPQSAHMDG
jgi:hypothetical protein